MPPFFTRGRTQAFVLLLLVTLVQLATSLGVAALVSELFRHLLAGQSTSGSLAWLMAGAIAITAGAEIARRTLTEMLGLDYARDVRLALFERLLRRPLRNGRTRSKGSQLLPFVGDLTALRQWWSDGIARGGSSAIIVIGISLWIFRIDAGLGWWMAGLTLLTLAIMAAIAGPYFSATRDQRAARGTLTALLSDRIGAAHTVMAMGGVQRELGQTRNRIERMNRASLRRAIWSGSMRGLIAAFPLAGVLVLANLATGRNGTPAMIAPHDVAGLLTLSGMLGGMLADIGRALELAIPAQIAGRRLHARMEEIVPITPAENGDRNDRKSLLALEDLALASPAEGFSARLARGEIVAVDGPHAGLLIEVLAGMQRPARGEARLCGLPAIGLGQRRRRQWLGIAAAWTPLLQDGLAENLLFRMRRGSGAADMPALMQILGLDHLLDDSGQVLPQRLRDEGGSLDPRDKAAIRLVRAMIARPRVLLLHRASLDLDQSQVLGLRGLLKGWPGVVVLATERAELTALATRTWSVDGGRITQIAREEEEIPHVAAIHALRPRNEG